MQWDLNWTVGSILAASAVLSPILTALINNRHLKKMRKLELEQEKYMETIVYKRKVLECYLQKTSKLILYFAEDQQNEYAESFGLAISYVPPNIRDEMIEIDKLINDSDSSRETYKRFISLVPELTAIVQSL